MWYKAECTLMPISINKSSINYGEESQEVSVEKIHLNSLKQKQAQFWNTYMLSMLWSNFLLH